MKNGVMQEPPVAQKNDRIPPVLHLLLSLSCRSITYAGELLLLLLQFTSSPLHILFFSSCSSPSSSPPSLHPIFSSSSLPPLLPPLCLNLGKLLARPPLLRSLSLNAHSVFTSAANQSTQMGFCSRLFSAVSCQSERIHRAAATMVTQQVCD